MRMQRVEVIVYEYKVNFVVDVSIVLFPESTSTRVVPEIVSIVSLDLPTRF
jgi:hypothetical protein